MAAFPEEEFHAVPRLSASWMPRGFGCAASYVRAWEAHDLRTRLGLAPPEPGQDALDGIQRHRVLAAIPFFSKALGLGRPVNLHEAIAAEAANLRIEFPHPSEYWYLYHAVRKRNRLIAHVIEQAGVPSVDRVSVRLDDERLFRVIPLADGGSTTLSGLPDVAALIRMRDGRLHGVLCDYKSGFKNPTPAPQNKQLLTLAHLLDHREPLTDCHVSLFARNHPSDFLDAAYFDRPRLDQAARVVVAKAAEAAELERLYRAEIPDARVHRPLSARLTARLEAASRVDAEGCAPCSGKICCSLLRRRMAVFAQEEMGSRETLLTAYRGIKARMKPTKTHPQGKASMTDQELSHALGETRQVTAQIKLFVALEEELSAVARAAVGSGRTLPGVDLEEGRHRFALKDGVRLPDLIRHLQTVVPKLNAELFVDQFGQVKAADVRGYLAGQLGIEESDVMGRLEAGLGSDNPFFMKPDQPSVRVARVEREEAREDVEPSPRLRA